MTAPITTQTFEDRMVALASELVMRVRDVDPERNRVWMTSLTDREREALPYVLTAMVDPETPLGVALGWTYALDRTDG